MKHPVKNGPFKLKLADNYPRFAQLLAKQICQFETLPDFSNEDALTIFSDYGGEHKEAKFNTYSFLISSYSSNQIFADKMNAIRKQFGLDKPFKEIEYKDLTYGPIERSLKKYLQLVDENVHGVLVTVSIEKSIKTVLTDNGDQTMEDLRRQFKNANAGIWKKSIAEKLIRILHPMCMVFSLVSQAGQKFVWMSDNDAINEDSKNRDFSHTQRIFGRVLMMYTQNDYDLYGFAKSFENHPETSDLLSLTDFSAGAMQEVLPLQQNLWMKSGSGRCPSSWYSAVSATW